MSSESIRNECPPTCPKVKKYLRAKIEKEPWLPDGIFPQKNDVYPLFPSDVTQEFREIQEEMIDVVHKKPIDYPEKTEEIPSKVIKDIVEITPISEETVIQEKKIIQKEAWLPDEISPQKNDVYPLLSPDVIEEFREIQEEVIDVVHKKPIDYPEKIEEVSSKVTVEDIVEVTPIPEETVVQEIKIVQELTERIADHNEKIDLVEEEVQEIAIIEEQAAIPMERIADHDEKIDLVEEEVQEIAIIEEQAAIPMERIADHDEKIDLVEEEVQEIAIIEEQAAIPMERIADHDEKIDSVEEEVQEIAIIEEQAAIPMEKIADYDEKKIDLIKEKELVTETTVAKSVKEIPVEKPEIIEDEIEQPAIAKIELELPQELEEYFEAEKRVEYGEDGITDYEKFIEEELQKSLPAIIVKKIPEEPRAMREEISKNAVYEKIDRNNSARPPREPERQAREEVPAKVKRIISRKPETADVCDETCPLVKEQKERFMRKLKERQRVIDHYYLTKGFSYFEDVCTCSLACMVYALNRDPFVRSVFASLALFAVGLKLCSELDAWEMPNRIS